MTRRRHLTTAIVLTLVVIFTAVGSPLAGTLVLCVGSDGHADLEVALGACCVDEPPRRVDGVGDEESARVDPCGGCADIELDATPLVKQKQLLDPPHAIGIAGSAEVRSRVLLPVGAGSGAEPAPPDLEAIATVVLLT